MQTEETNVQDDAHEVIKDTTEQTTKRDDILQKFNRTVRECVQELKSTFPELSGTIDERYAQLADTDVHIVEWFQQNVSGVMQQLTQKDSSVFSSRTHPNGLFLLPDIDFVQLWKRKLTSSTKAAIWKYLHVLMLLLSHYQLSTNDFESTLKQWDSLLDGSEKLGEEELERMKAHSENIMKLMQSLSANDEEDDGEDGEDGEEAKEDASDQKPDDDPFLQQLQQSKIAKFAEELSKEIDIGDFGLNAGDVKSAENSTAADTADSVKDMFSSFGKDPQKLMKLVQSVGNKIQSKLTDGDINQRELVEEAQNLMSSMKDSTNFKRMFKKQRKKGGQKGGGMDPQSLFNMLTKQMGSMQSGAGGGGVDEQAMQQAMSSMLSGGGGGGMEQLMGMMNAGAPPRRGSRSTKDRLRRKLEERKNSVEEPKPATPAPTAATEEQVLDAILEEVEKEMD